MPSQDSGPWSRRFSSAACRPARDTDRAAISTSRNRSTMCSLHVRRPPKNSTFEPTTGPRSSRTGRSSRPTADRNLGNTVDVAVASSPGRATAEEGTGTAGFCPFENTAQRTGAPAGGAADGAGACGLTSAAFVSAFSPARCMSIEPRKCAPSEMATRGAMRSPSTEPLSRMSIFSTAVMFPCTCPCTTTDLARIFAMILPLALMVSMFCRSSMVPSTSPSMVMSSLALKAPLTTTLLPMWALSLPEDGRTVPVSWLGGTDGAGPGAAGGRTASSFFHMRGSIQRECYDETIHVRIYLDYNATAPPAPGVVDAVCRVLQDSPGNPSSIHAPGQQARAVLDTARLAVAALIGAAPSDVILTGGGTEADNLAIRGAAEALLGNDEKGRKHLITTAIEHEAVLTTCAALERRGWRITRVPVDRSGVVSPEAVDAALAAAPRGDAALVSVMHANNE